MKCKETMQKHLELLAADGYEGEESGGFASVPELVDMAVIERAVGFAEALEEAPVAAEPRAVDRVRAAAPAGVEPSPPRRPR